MGIFLSYNLIVAINIQYENIKFENREIEKQSGKLKAK